ncbi:sulfatase-like hydrolase/transferase [Draconibacterium sp. IB214405]|uniref:sulfatase family protein n=1 Tax=Draconibacterium sp. IB214405 TaxID=3097352 RepID=UPI002A1230C6|nr:sulfatase-like hydrolase/transferase [Draconibacterium sp. IB214405]MDX8339639.1 sulfatase-like hydrolase/transferase [Draconibacterium sp. IB214405]
MNLYQLIILFTAFVIFTKAGNAQQRINKETKPPNIVFILLDDLGYGDLSCQGGKDIYTPNIDNLFEEGIKFNNFYANSPCCSPTRAALMTGRFPDMVGVPGLVRSKKEANWGYLLPGVKSLPEMLKKVGYHTAIVGKWNLGLESPNLPNDKGFDFFHGFLDDMMDDYWTHLRQGENYMRFNKDEVNPQGHATDIFSDWSIDYIRNETKQEKPFFLYLAYNAPHFPIQPPEEWLDKVKKREKNIEEKRAKNVALVEHLDHGIGRVIKALKEANQYENTIIIFSSDNGGLLSVAASNGNLRGGKTDMYEGGIKVPTCMVWKNKIKPGSKTNVLGLTMDFYPTLCKIAGVEIEHEIDGIDLNPLISEENQKAVDRMVFFMRRDGYDIGGLCYYAMRKGQYKLVQNRPFEELQLFNTEVDPKEEKPLGDSDQLFRKLRYELSQHIRYAGSIPWEKKSSE